MIGIYCRVSGKKQEDGYSLPEQEEKGIRYATEQGEPYLIYRDVVTGTGSKRLDKVKRDIEAGKIDRLWIIHNDRLTRLPPVQAYDFRDFLLKHNIEVIERDRPFDIKSLLVYGVNAVVNYDFIERLKVKVLDAKAAQRNAGRQAYSSMFGYEPRIVGATHNGKAARVWEINQEKAAIVRQIFAMNIEERLGLAEICKRLNGKGYKSERGKNFEPSAVSRILYHIEYAGKSRAKDGTIIEGKIYPAIIDLETWQAAQGNYTATITNNSKRGRVASHAMTNILHCDYCGAGYYYHFGQSPYKWKDSDRVTIRYRHTYYHRHTVPCANECKNLSMEALDIMGLVVYRRAMTEQSAELLTEVARDIKRKMDDDALLIQSLEGELKVKLGEIKNFENAIAKGLSPESAIANINRREGEAKAIRESVKAIEEREIQGRKEYSLMMAEFSLSKYQEYINASPKIRLEMFKRILRKATNRDGELSFELIDGRIYKIGYKAFAETYKQIRKDADTLLSVMAEKSSHEEAMAKLKASYAGEKMLKEIAKAFKDNSGHYGEALRDWEYHYIVISYLISKAP